MCRARPRLRRRRCVRLPGPSDRVAEAANSLPPGFDEGASYVGVSAPGGGEPWAAGWTDDAERRAAHVAAPAAAIAGRSLHRG